MLSFRQAFRWLVTEIRGDRRMQVSISLGLILAPANVWLFRYLVSMGYDKFLVNIVISLGATVIWYFINRRLFSDRQACTKRTAAGSFAWWALSFGLHQAAFVGAVGVVGLPYLLVKGVQLGLEPPEFFAKFWFNKNKLFVSETEMA